MNAIPFRLLDEETDVGGNSSQGDEPANEFGIRPLHVCNILDTFHFVGFNQPNQFAV
jgi:hypothetical protein